MVESGTLATLVALGALLAPGAGAAFAQGPTATPPLGGPQDSLVAIAAQMLGMERTALMEELNAGKTIADVAKTSGVAVSRIVDVMFANRAAALKAAVDAKSITQPQMDAELAAMKTNNTA